MRKILLRGVVHPLEIRSPENVLVYNNIGNNSGNMIYNNSVFRMLLTEDTQIDMDYYKGEKNQFTDQDIDFINSEYDAYVVTLADAFRDNFAERLNNYASVFRKLTIPCYVIGVGIRAPYEPNLKEGFSFDEAVKNFVSATVEKSSMLGLRGEITGEYLKTLGFKEERDFTVIGCPSLYTYGKHLKQRPLKIHDDMRISVNYNVEAKPELKKYLNDLALSYKNGQFVAQRTAELGTLYLGMKNLNNPLENYPLDFAHDLYQNDRVKFFISASSWIDDMQNVDLSFGGRMHGNVAAILGGAPVIYTPVDARMRELAEYHCFPQIPNKDFDVTKGIEEIVSGIDLQSHLKRHSETFSHFLDFMKKNGIETIFTNDENRKDAPYDKLVVHNQELVTSIMHCSKEEAMERMWKYHNEAMKKETEKFTASKENYKKTIKENKDEIKELKRQLNPKLVRGARRLNTVIHKFM